MTSSRIGKTFSKHASRLRDIAKVLKDHNLRFGLEYVGPKTSWASRRYPFIHTMAEMKELIAEIDTGNVVFSWIAGIGGTPAKPLMIFYP